MLVVVKHTVAKPNIACFPPCVAGPGVRIAEVMLAAGVLPALEQLFRQLPVVSFAHVNATVLLVRGSHTLTLDFRLC
jgi:hypothetical protein